MHGYGKFSNGQNGQNVSSDFSEKFFLLDCDLAEKHRTKPQNKIYQKVEKIHHNILNLII